MTSSIRTAHATSRLAASVAVRAPAVVLQLLGMSVGMPPRSPG